MLRMFSEKGYSSVTRALDDRPAGVQAEAADQRHRRARKLYLDTLDLGAKGYTVYRTVPPYPPVDHEIDVAIQTIVSQAEDREGGDGAGAAECADAAEARRREAVGRCRARPPSGRTWAAAAARARSAAGLRRRCWCWRRITLGPALYLVVTSLTPLTPVNPDTAFDFSDPLAELPGDPVATDRVLALGLGAGRAVGRDGRRRSSLAGLGARAAARPAVALPGGAAHRLPDARWCCRRSSSRSSGR